MTNPVIQKVTVCVGKSSAGRASNSHLLKGSLQAVSLANPKPAISFHQRMCALVHVLLCAH